MIKPGLHILFLLVLLRSGAAFSQEDSASGKLKVLVEKGKDMLIDDSIPKRTAWDIFMYPHRWYVKQLLKPKQPYFDTTYIQSHKKNLTIALPVAKKFFGFNFIDLEAKKTLKFSPNNYYYIGFNLSNIIFTAGFYPGFRFGAKPNKGRTSGKDYQLTIIGRRVITDINYQSYKGFYVFNTRDYQVDLFNEGNASIFIRPDVNVFSFGANTMFIFNYKKYSLRGGFSFTDIQRRSAGSFMVGLYHSYTLFTAFDSTLVPRSMRPDFSPGLYDIFRVSLITVGLSGGYGYNLVYKKIILSTAVNAGMGIQKTNYQTTDDKGHTLSMNPALNLNAKAAIRYDNLRFFIGLLSSYNNNYTLNPRLFNTSNYSARVVIFSGYRFSLRNNGHKLLKAMGLVDYN